MRPFMKTVSVAALALGLAACGPTTSEQSETSAAAPEAATAEPHQRPG